MTFGWAVAIELELTVAADRWVVVLVENEKWVSRLCVHGIISISWEDLGKEFV